MKNHLKAIFLAAFCLAANQLGFAQTKNVQSKIQTNAKAPAWEEASTDRSRLYVLRLKPGQDLRVELERFAKAKHLQAGFIVTCAGSLQKASLRLADKRDSTNYAGKFEIVSLVGTLTPDGPHLHISISDGEGKMLGGHLVAGCEIYTTAEIVIGEAIGLKMTREQDSQSGYKELKVYKKTRVNR